MNGSTPMSTMRVIVAGRVVGVQRREHEVTGERGLDRDVDGLGVADLTDQDDVGVLTQDRPQRAGEGQPALRVDLHLVDAVERYSTGSSTVTKLILRRRDLLARTSRASSTCPSPSGR